MVAALLVTSNAVVPFAPPAPGPSFQQEHSALSQVAQFVVDKYSRMKRLVLEEGSYSVARLQALEAYRQKTKWWRVLLITVLSPLPACSVSILFNVFPLANPREGLAANYGFFIRCYAVSVMFIIAAKWQREYLLGWKSSWKMNFLLMNVAGSLFALIGFALAKIWGSFPVPFMPIFVFGIDMPISVAITMAILRRDQKKRQQRTNQKQTSPQFLTKFKRFAVFEYSLVFIYSAYSVGFKRLSGHNNLIYVCSLPVLKFVLAIVAKRLVAHMEDLAEEIVVFSVEFFNAIFISILMGGAPSKWTSFLLMGFDFVHMMYSMIKLHYNAKLLVEKHLKTTTTAGNCVESQPPPTADVILACLRFAHFHKSLLAHDRGIRFDPSKSIMSRHFKGWNWNPQVIAEDPSEQPLPSKQIKPLLKPNCNWMSPTTPIPVQAKTETPRVLASPPTVAVRAPCEINSVASLSAEEFEQRAELLRDLLTFMCLLEHVVLVEYIEVFVPFFYALYVIATYYGPNRFFFYGILELTDDSLRSSTQNVVIYALLECVSLLVLYLMVKRHFGFNVFYTLGFVLETHFYNIQGKILLFLMIILNCALIHCGMDFQFKFEYRTAV